MKLVKIRSMTELMMSKQIWKLGNGDVEHEEYDGVVKKNMTGINYLVNCQDDLVIHDETILDIAFIYKKDGKKYPCEGILMGWMINDLGKYKPSIDEIVDMM